MLDKCIELVTQVSGRRPTGYVAPWWEFSTVTNELLLERHSSARGDRRQPHGSFLTRRWEGTSAIVTPSAVKRMVYRSERCRRSGCSAPWVCQLLASISLKGS